MKRFLFTILVFANLQGFAQTFKITDVQTFNDSEYQKYTKKYMGKEFKVTFNDNSITITPTDKPSPLTLKKDNDKYSYMIKNGNYYLSYLVTFGKTLGIISSMEFTLTERPITSLNYSNRVKIIGKRF